jgi:hypothetical protein
MKPILNSTVKRILQKSTELFMNDSAVITRKISERGTMGQMTEVYQFYKLVKCRIIKDMSKRQTTEEVGEQEVMVELLRLIVPVGTGLAADMRATVKGATYEITGILDQLSDSVDEQALIARVK